SFFIGLFVTKVWLYLDYLNHTNCSSVQVQILQPAKGNIASTTEIPKLTLCDLITNGDKYNHQVVRVQATLYSGIDVVAIGDSECGNNYAWVRPGCESPEACDKIYKSIDDSLGENRNKFWRYDI